MDNRPIGVFDSGIGGITVLREVLKQLPKEDIVYLGDTARLPYGTKSKDTVVQYSKQAIDFLIDQGVKAVVIACGTATSQALEEVKKLYDIPVIGVIEPTVERLEENHNNIGVIATAGTIRSNAWETAIKKKHPNVNIYSRACPVLVQLAEDGWTDNEIAKLVIKEYLKELKEKNIDELILGCTHYPLFKNIIEAELGANVTLVDTGKKCSEYLKDLLEESNLNCDKEKGNCKFYLTDVEENFFEVAKRILSESYELAKKDIELVKL